MLKKLQKQIEKEKQELVKPVKEKLQAVFQNFEIEVDFEGDEKAIAVLTSKGKEGLVNLSFILDGDQKVFTNHAVEYEIRNGVLIAAKAVPFSIDFQVLGFVFYELNELLALLKDSEEELEETEE